MLAKFSKQYSTVENIIGASIAGEIGDDEVYCDVVNLRNCLTHYDSEKLQKYLTVFENIDYCDLCPIKRDSVIRHCFNIFSKVDWKCVRKYLIGEER